MHIRPAHSEALRQQRKHKNDLKSLQMRVLRVEAEVMQQRGRERYIEGRKNVDFELWSRQLREQLQLPSRRETDHLTAMAPQVSQPQLLARAMHLQPELIVWAED